MSRKLMICFVSIIASIALLTGCSHEKDRNVQESVDDMSIKLTSSAFKEGEMIPRKYSCDDENISPPLVWSGNPEETKSFALIVDDPDAPAGNWVHWVLYNIPANQGDLSEGVAGVGIQGENTSGKLIYGGPCPPKGPAHRYFFKFYALDTVLDLNAGATKGELEKAMQGHILAQGQLMGKYQR